MKKILISLAAFATLATATAASAQPTSFTLFNSINGREAAAARRIAWCEAHHRMSHAQAAALRSQLRMIERIEWRLRHGGLTFAEYRYLSGLLSRLEARIRVACRPDFVVVNPHAFERIPHRGPPGPGPVERQHLR